MSDVREYREADADHRVVPSSAYGDELADECEECGLACTSDGRYHGTDETHPVGYVEVVDTTR